jgi:hypothetical protein
MNGSNKNKLIIWILVLIVIIGGGFWITRGGEGSRLSEEDRQALSGDEITVNGTIRCLEYKSEKPDQLCVRGIVGENGVVYAINSVAVKSAELKLGTGTDVVAVGVFEPADSASSESNVFIYDGVLVLSSLKAR